MFFIVQGLGLILLLSSVIGNVLDPKYRTICNISSIDSESAYRHYANECFVALFSYHDIEFNGPVVFLDDGLCAESLQNFSYLVPLLLSLDVAVVAKRGLCNFSQKAKNAQKLGFKLLLISNNQPDSFPLGPPQIDFDLTIPVLMAGSGVWDNMQALAAPAGRHQSTNMDTTISGDVVFLSKDDKALLQGLPKLSLLFDAAPVPVAAAKPAATPALGKFNIGPGEKERLNGTAVRYMDALFTVAALAGAVVVVLAAWETAAGTGVFILQVPSCLPSTSVATCNGAWLAAAARWLSCGIVCAVFLALRLGTLRIYSTGTDQNDDDGGVVYNHRETDERVFEALVHNVLKDPSDYRLHSSTIEGLGLAPENYSDSLFIHPPLFVLVSAVLHRCADLPLALVPLLLQILTLSLLSGLCAAILPRDRMGSVPSAGILAMVVFSCCPIAAFCSQKFWIDNCLMAAVTLCAAVHVSLLPCNIDQNPHNRSSVLGFLLRCVLSGLVFGIIGLNCKITAAALLPFALLWIALQRFTHAAAVEDDQSALAVGLQTLPVSAAGGLGYILGATTAYVPWAYLYWSHTGRWTPNAWPSPTMLARSSFVRAAVLKPWSSYLRTLLLISPLHLLGLLFAAVLGLRLVGTRITYSSTASCSKTCRADLLCVIRVLFLAAWPFGFLFGLTALGSLGSGFQSRFLAPMLPGSAVLLAVCAELLHRKAATNVSVRQFTAAFGGVLVTAALYSTLHVFYYGVLYAPLFADLDASLLDVLREVLGSPYYAPDNREAFMSTLSFMKHYGLVRQST